VLHKDPLEVLGTCSGIASAAGIDEKITIVNTIYYVTIVIIKRL
jgi:hypothetical protein